MVSIVLRCDSLPPPKYQTIPVEKRLAKPQRLTKGTVTFAMVSSAPVPVPITVTDVMAVKSSTGSRMVV